MENHQSKTGIATGRPIGLMMINGVSVPVYLDTFQVWLLKKHL